MKDLNRIINRYIVLRMNRFAQVVNQILYVWFLNTPLKLNIRQQIKSLLKALLYWSVVKKYFSTVGWDRFRWSRSKVSCQKVVLNFFVVAKLIRKHLYGSLVLINLQAFSLKETSVRTFSCRFLQILKEHVYLKNYSGWMLL